jgi:diguanylate cyclase (GGDEF)-like protein
MFNVIPKDDTDQALRIRRFFMAFASYMMWMVFVFYCFAQGFFRMPIGETLALSAFVVSFNLAVYIILRSGFNKRFKDPSLTILQMILATFVIIVVAYYTDEIRGILLLIYLVVFVFGAFRLQLRQFFAMALFALTGYGYVIALLLAHHPDKIDLRIELLQLVVLAAVLSWFSLIGSYINHLRGKLVKTNIELSTANETIRHSAIIDELTQVYNRRQMIRLLQREKALADRGEPSFSLCILDLDDFKWVNDNYGHLMGDMVLKTVVRAIKDNVREQDYIARYGGEEFVVILAYPDLDDAIICAQRLKELTSNLIFPGLPEDFRITISIGVSKYQPIESIDALIGRADAALYRAKLNGKNRIEPQDLSLCNQEHLESPTG